MLVDPVEKSLHEIVGAGDGGNVGAFVPSFDEAEIDEHPQGFAYGTATDPQLQSKVFLRRKLLPGLELLFEDLVFQVFYDLLGNGTSIDLRELHNEHLYFLVITRGAFV
jgi:hypothetical protein